MRRLVLALTLLVKGGVALAQWPDYWQEQGESWTEDDPVPVQQFYPRYRATAQWGAYHTVVVPNYQWSQRGVGQSRIVPNEYLPYMNVAPPGGRFIGYSIDVSPYVWRPAR